MHRRAAFDSRYIYIYIAEEAEEAVVHFTVKAEEAVVHARENKQATEIDAFIFVGALIPLLMHSVFSFHLVGMSLSDAMSLWYMAGRHVFRT